MKRDTLPESSAASINFIQRKVSAVRSISNERSSREENQEKDREVRQARKMLALQLNTALILRQVSTRSQLLACKSRFDRVRQFS